MRIWNLDDSCDLEDGDTQIVDLNTDAPVGILIPGPPGVGSSGTIGTAIADADIPLGQVYTIANPTAPCLLVLPPIASVIEGNQTTAYVIKNVSLYVVTIEGSGVDPVEFGVSATLPFQNGSLTLLASSLGWLVI